MYIYIDIMYIDFNSKKDSGKILTQFQNINSIRVLVLGV